MNKKQLFLGILMTVTTAANAQQKNGNVGKIEVINGPLKKY